MFHHAQLGSSMRFSIAVLIALTQPVTLAPQTTVAGNTGHVISGRVEDPYDLRPEGAILMLGEEDSGGFLSTPVPIGANGSFVTRAVKPGTYVLEVIRTPHSATKAIAGPPQWNGHHERANRFQRPRKRRAGSHVYAAPGWRSYNGDTYVELTLSGFATQRSFVVNYGN